MFSNPLEELNRQASQGCLLLMTLMALPVILVFLLIVGGWLVVKIWPLLALGAVVWVAVRIARRRSTARPARSRAA